MGNGGAHASQPHEIVQVELAANFRIGRHGYVQRCDMEPLALYVNLCHGQGLAGGEWHRQPAVGASAQRVKMPSLHGAGAVFDTSRRSRIRTGDGTVTTRR